MRRAWWMKKHQRTSVGLICEANWCEVILVQSSCSARRMTVAATCNNKVAQTQQPTKMKLHRECQNSYEVSFCVVNRGPAQEIGDDFRCFVNFGTENVIKPEDMRTLANHTL